MLVFHDFFFLLEANPFFCVIFFWRSDAGFSLPWKFFWIPNPFLLHFFCSFCILWNAEDFLLNLSCIFFAFIVHYLCIIYAVLFLFFACLMQFLYALLMQSSKGVSWRPRVEHHCFATRKQKQNCTRAPFGTSKYNKICIQDSSK